MGFGERFKTLLKKNNLTQRKFAEDTETHQGLITRYIKEDVPSRLLENQLRQIARFFQSQLKVF